MSARAIYLDHAATTDIRESVVEAMAKTMREVGNASSLHSPGRRARQRVEEAREEIAGVLGADPIEVIFTSGATEADNLALKGGFTSRRDIGSVVVLSPAEHHAVLDTVRWLADTRGAQIRWSEVDSDGTLRAASVRGVIDESVAIGTAMWANNEVGTMSPIADIADVYAEFSVPFHCDAVQAIGRVPINFASLAADSIAVSAHKIGGPQGIGALLARRSFTPAVQVHGGGQERQIRSGTLPVASIVGFGVAMGEAERERESESARLGVLRDRLAEQILALPDVRINGHATYDAATTLPGILSMYAPGCDGDALLMLLDTEGIAVSTGSACTAGVSELSHVVLAMTGDEARAKSTLRISLGRTTTTDDIDTLVARLPAAIERARAASGYRG